MKENLKPQIKAYDTLYVIEVMFSKTSASGGRKSEWYVTIACNPKMDGSGVTRNRAVFSSGETRGIYNAIKRHYCAVTSDDVSKMDKPHQFLDNAQAPYELDEGGEFFTFPTIPHYVRWNGEIVTQNGKPVIHTSVKSVALANLEENAFSAMRALMERTAKDEELRVKGLNKIYDAFLGISEDSEEPDEDED